MRRKTLSIVVLLLMVTLTFAFAVPILKVNPCELPPATGGCPYFPPNAYPTVSLTRYYIGIGGLLGPSGPVRVYMLTFGNGQYYEWKV